MMRFAKRKITSAYSRAAPLNIGYVPTVDCATLIAAHELGLFQKHGLHVRLSREVGWATIREKILHEELDAAVAHASMLFSIYGGIGGVRRSCLTGLMMSASGSAITLSSELWNMDVRDAASLGRLLRDRKAARTFVFGVALELSSQHHALRKWLVSGGIDPQRDVRMVVIPSSVIYETFREGFLDGYCVAEPWNSTAVLDKTGWVAATTSEIEPQHLEKVLLVLQDFADSRGEEHLRLIAALIEASQFCDARENRRELARMLSRCEYLDMPIKYLVNALIDRFEMEEGQASRGSSVDHDAFKVSAPDQAHARWVFEMVRALGQVGDVSTLHPDVVNKVFRKDIYEEALKLVPRARAAPIWNDSAAHFGTGQALPRPGLSCHRSHPAPEDIDAEFVLGNQ